MTFKKYVQSAKALYLKRNHLPSFLLLMQIAENAQYEDCEARPWMKAGYAFIGDYANVPMTRKEYRNALIYLEENGYIEIICVQHKLKQGFEKMQKKGHQINDLRAIERATNGTLVNIIDDSVWDVISPDQKEKNQQKGHQKGHQNEQFGANEGPPRGHNQEERRRDKEDISKEEIKKEVAVPAPISTSISFLHAEHVTSFFDPSTFLLANGEPLSLRTQRAFSKYEGKSRERLLANIRVYLEDAKTKVLKPGKTHEEWLQGYVNYDFAKLRQQKANNLLWFQSEIIPRGIRAISVKDSVINIKIHEQETISVILELPELEFASRMEKAIERYYYKTKELYEAFK